MKRLQQLGLCALLLLLAPAVSAQDYTENLGAPQEITIKPGTDLISAGVGLYGDGAGTIEIEIPAGATVQQVLLYWGGRATMGDRDNTIVIESTEVTGRYIGQSAVDTPDGLEAFTYRYDVTSLVTLTPGTMNSVELSGFEDPIPGNDLDRPTDQFRADGASLLVVVDDGSTPKSIFDIREGSDMAYLEYVLQVQKETELQTFTFDPAPVEREAKLIFFVGDTNLDRGDRLIVWVGGVEVLNLPNYFQQLAGRQWSNREKVITIPAGATEVKARVYSESIDGNRSESLTWNLASLVLPGYEPPGDPGCTLTQGYWKTHSEEGPAPDDPRWSTSETPAGGATDFFDTGKSWYEIFWTPPAGGNAYLQLAHQWMAATLNVLNGADASEVEEELAIGSELLSSYSSYWNDPKGLKKEERDAYDRMGEIAGILDDYNNGLIGPGHCDDSSELTETTAARSMAAPDAFGVSAYPNPFAARTTIEVSLAEAAPMRAAVYDVVGRRVAVLAEGMTEAGVHRFEFDASSLSAGIYLYRVELPTGVETGRLSVVR